METRENKTETKEKTMVTYEYPMNGNGMETVATLADGRVVTVNVQYSAVLPHGKHSGDCDQLNQMGGRCTCGLLDGIDVDGLMADARINGKRGFAPQPESKATVDDAADNGICRVCGTYCCGDCQAK